MRGPCSGSSSQTSSAAMPIKQAEDHHGDDGSVARAGKVKEDIAGNEADQQLGKGQVGDRALARFERLGPRQFRRSGGKFAGIEAENRSHGDADQGGDHGRSHEQADDRAADLAERTDLLHLDHRSDHHDQHQRHDDQPQQVDIAVGDDIGPLDRLPRDCRAGAEYELQIEAVARADQQSDQHPARQPHVAARQLEQKAQQGGENDEIENGHGGHANSPRRLL